MSASSEAVVITLPIPPSTNRLWITKSGGGGKTLAKPYRQWLADAGWLLETQRPRRITGPVEIKVDASRPSQRRDLDNLLKALLDLLVRHKVITDDRHVEAISARWVPQGIPGVRITIREAKGGQKTKSIKDN